MKNLLFLLLCLCCFHTASSQNGQLIFYAQNIDSFTTPIIADVYLIQYDNAAGTLTALQTKQTDGNGSGQVIFEDVPPGQYLVKAAVVAGTVGFTENMPTYYGDVLLWSDASYITLEPGSYNAAVIHLIPGDNPGGPGFIGGLVSEGANFTHHETEAEFSGEGDPVAGASIVVTTPDGTGVAHATTNSLGQYNFPSLAYGTYVVTIDIPGVAPVSITVTLSADQPVLAGLNFNVDQNSATLATGDAGYEAFTSVSPNPASDAVQVNLKEANGMLLLTNGNGQIVQNVNVTGKQMRLSLASLPQGTYFLTVRTAKGSQSTRVVKQ